jgi:abortive infection bacteriophage resistance protein
MRYEKPALTLDEQVQRWRERGLVVPDATRAKGYLATIGYYRISAYCLPFEAPTMPDQPRSHQFRPGTQFDDVLALYVFDRKLRLCVMEAIERVEVAVRTCWAHELALRHGSHAHMNPSLFKSPWEHTRDLARVAADLEGSTETFVVHYRRVYAEPFLPPVWAIVETMSLGTLSRWVKNTRSNDAKMAVARVLGLPTVEVLEGVLHALTPVRNVCAHHGRLWNRRLALTLPHIKRYRESLVPPDAAAHQAHHLYNPLTVLALMMARLSPGSSWRRRTAELVEKTLPPHFVPAMGFPPDWLDRPAWRLEEGLA